MKEEKAVSAFEVKKPRQGLSGAGLSEKTRAALQGVSSAWVPSKFNVSVDLPGNLQAVYNTFMGSLTVVPREIWSRFSRPAPGARSRGIIFRNCWTSCTPKASWSPRVWTK